MKEELTNKLFEAGKVLYRDKNESEMNTCMCFGFECYDTWFDLLAELTNKLEGKNKELAEKGVKIIADQVKEKFGSLRFYYHTEGVDKLSPEEDKALNDFISDAIVEAEEKSMLTCAYCGSVGNTKAAGGWITYLCPACIEKSQESVLSEF